MVRNLLERFPGAEPLSGTDFAATIVGRRFRYRGVHADAIVERPNEVFHPNGYYELHGLRVVSHGSYRFAAGIVTITSDAAFLGMGRNRLFFRHRQRLFVTDGVNTFELIEIYGEIVMSLASVCDLPANAAKSDRAQHRPTNLSPPRLSAARDATVVGTHCEARR